MCALLNEIISRLLYNVKIYIIMYLMCRKEKDKAETLVVKQKNPLQAAAQYDDTLREFQRQKTFFSGLVR